MILICKYYYFHIQLNHLYNNNHDKNQYNLGSIFIILIFRLNIKILIKKFLIYINFNTRIRTRQTLI